MFVREGWRKKRERHREGEGRRERKRGNERILIRNPKNKIIRLPDSKCQLREDSRWRWRGGARQRNTAKKGRGRRGKETFRRRQVGLE